jgi:hypothetical protein
MSCQQTTASTPVDILLSMLGPNIENEEIVECKRKFEDCDMNVAKKTCIEITDNNDSVNDPDELIESDNGLEEDNISEEYDETESKNVIEKTQENNDELLTWYSGKNTYIKTLPTMTENITIAINISSRMFAQYKFGKLYTVVSVNYKKRTRILNIMKKLLPTIIDLSRMVVLELIVTNDGVIISDYINDDMITNKIMYIGRLDGIKTLNITNIKILDYDTYKKIPVSDEYTTNIYIRRLDNILPQRTLIYKSQFRKLYAIVGFGIFEKLKDGGKVTKFNVALLGRRNEKNELITCGFSKKVFDHMIKIFSVGPSVNNTKSIVVDSRTKSKISHINMFTNPRMIYVVELLPTVRNMNTSSVYYLNIHPIEDVLQFITDTRGLETKRMWLVSEQKLLGHKDSI